MLTALLIKWSGEATVGSIKSVITSKVFWIVLGLVSLSAGSAWYAYSYEHKRWQQQIEQINIAAKAQHDVDQATITRNKQASEILADLSKESEDKLNENLSKSNNELNAALLANKLLNHPKRPTEGASVTSNNTAVGDTTYTTADNLYQDDQQLFINFSNSTDQVVLKLNSCIERYNLVRDKVNSGEQTVLPPFEKVE